MCSPALRMLERALEITFVARVVGKHRHNLQILQVHYCKCLPSLEVALLDTSKELCWLRWHCYALWKASKTVLTRMRDQLTQC